MSDSLSLLLPATDQSPSLPPTELFFISFRFPLNFFVLGGNNHFFFSCWKKKKKNLTIFIYSGDLWHDDNREKCLELKIHTAIYSDKWERLLKVRACWPLSKGPYSYQNIYFLFARTHTQPCNLKWGGSSGGVRSPDRYCPPSKRPISDGHHPRPFSIFLGVSHSKFSSVSATHKWTRMNCLQTFTFHFEWVTYRQEHQHAMKPKTLQIE